MKKIALALAAFGLVSMASPVFACPGHEDGATKSAPENKTADKSDNKAKDAPAKKKDAPAKKTDDSKKADTKA